MKRIFILISFFCLAGVANTLFAQEVKINHPGADGLTIQSDGSIKLDGTATVWDDLRVPLSEPSTGTVKPEWGKFPYGNTGSAPFINWFKDSGVDEMYFVVQIPHDYAYDTAIEAHIHWVPSANGSANSFPLWALQYTWANLGAAFPGYTTITGFIPFPNETLEKDKHYLTKLGTITGTNKTLSSMLVCRIYRDGSHASDTYGGLAGALEFDFHYQRNTMGSRDELTK